MITRKEVIRVVFNWVSKVVRVCFSFALLRCRRNSIITLLYSQHCVTTDLFLFFVKCFGSGVQICGIKTKKNRKRTAVKKKIRILKMIQCTWDLRKRCGTCWTLERWKFIHLSHDGIALSCWSRRFDWLLVFIRRWGRLFTCRYL